MIENRILLKNLNIKKTQSFSEYVKNDGFYAFKKALKLSPEKVIAEISDSGLRGRGGAGFPTGMKWKFTAQSNSEIKYAICNADEGEPGTFKDRYLMEFLPFLYIEGLMIASYAINASKAIVYIRGEYNKSIKETEKAIKKLYNEKLLGKNILESNYSLDIEIKLGAGSYLCGEELTLIESIEGKRGNPRIKPPFPAEKGLFGKPTLVNNVETLANIPIIINKSAINYKKIGTEKSKGTKLITLSGDILKPGIYEIPFGVKLSELIKLAGGTKNKIKAILVGGAAGTFVSLKDIEIELDYDILASKQYVLGSGAIMIFDEEKSLKEILHSILKFFKHESCGKCVPCRVGTAKLVDISKKMSKSKNIENLLQELLLEAQFIAKTSLCPLGQSPILPIRSIINNYRKDL